MRTPSPLLRRVYDRVFRLRNEHPALQRTLTAANRVLRVRPPVRFDGWGMTTTHEPPWTTGEDDRVFRESLRLAGSLTFTGEAGITAGTVDTLAWRHWVVSFAARCAAATRDDGVVEAVECGVADGTTAFFALRELESLVEPDRIRFHLYDAWDAIPAASVLPSEQFQAGRYRDLSRALTERNLASFAERLVWHIGYLPESLDAEPSPPERIAFVHIDLNASQPTKAVCERLWPSVVPGGVMLFDDYGWLGFEDTKRVVDEFAHASGGLLLKLPTAQALLMRPR